LTDNQQIQPADGGAYKTSRPEGLEQAIWYETPLLGREVPMLQPLAWEELMCRRVGSGHPPVVHIWRHTDGMTIGLRDRRLSNAAAAMEQIQQEGTSICVRPSGGAAVPLHPGILNLSIILPNPKHRINIHEDFQFMADWISQAVHPWSSEVDTGEVEGAFCPGDYDISIHGRKFCGIAQRRQAKAYIITAFVIVDGQGDELADQIRQFYERAAGPEDQGYPVVRQGTMGALGELAGVPSVDAYQTELQRLLSDGQLPDLLDGSEVFGKEELEQMVTYLHERYDE